MLLIVTVASFFVLGRELSKRFWKDAATAPRGAELVVAAFSIAFALWLASLWIAALAGFLSPPFLALRNVAVAFLAAIFWFRRWRSERLASRLRRPGGMVLLVTTPLLIWSAFILWRGWIVPPLSHDALAYHLPKAALYMRAETYDPLPELPARARNLPVNYELLLADSLIVEGNDRASEWLSLVHYLYFVAAAAALARRWWNDGGDASLIAALLTAATPVALLHSGAHKNDLMTAALMTASMVWIGRFITTAELRSLILAAATLAMAAGTKPQAAILALAAMPLVLFELRRKNGDWAKRLAVMVLVSLLFVILLGGAYWFVDRMQTTTQGPVAQSVSTPVNYGDWVNLWQVPYVLLSAPFSRSATALAVPWSEQPWFWRRYEIYFSELGVPFAVCALLLPVAILRYRNQTEERRRERLVVTTIAALTLLVMLPVRFRPLGFYAISAPRYMLFIVPVVFAWGVVPFLRHSAVFRHAVAAAAMIIFGTYATLNATRDVFVPMRYLRWAAAHQGTRVVPFEPNRAASVVDRAAAPDDAVAIEAAEGAWLYPVFGSELSRPVQLLPAFRPVTIAADTEWIVIDRTFLSVWKHPDFHDLSDTRRFITRGGSDLRTDPLVRSLLDAEDWSAFRFDERAGQAIFRRKR